MHDAEAAAHSTSATRVLAGSYGTALAPLCPAQHALLPDVRRGNICDICDTEGTSLRCDVCDYDVCRA